MKDVVGNITAVVLGIALILLGTQKQLVGDADLHGFLIAFGLIMVIIGGLNLI